MTKNGQNMAKIEKIRKMQIIDNKEDKFFYFPIISMPCTGSGYLKSLIVERLSGVFLFFGRTKTLFCKPKGLCRNLQIKKWMMRKSVGVYHRLQC